MPAGALILCAQHQHGDLCLWAEVIVGSPFVKRRIYIRGTGHEYTGNHVYIDTVQQLHGTLVWHLFDGGEFAP